MAMRKATKTYNLYTSHTTKVGQSCKTFKKVSAVLNVDYRKYKLKFFQKYLKVSTELLHTVLERQCIVMA